MRDGKWRPCRIASYWLEGGTGWTLFPDLSKNLADKYKAYSVYTRIFAAKQS
jgi:hypothetical protein